MPDSEIVVALKLVADQFQSQMKEAESSMGSFFGLSAGAAAEYAVVIGAVYEAMKTLTLGAAEAGAELQILSEKTGIAVQTMQEWSVAMAQSHLEPQAFMIGMRQLAKAMVEFEQGSGKGFEAFKSLGIDPTTETGLKDSAAVIEEIRAKVSEFKDGPGKEELFRELFGRGGQDWIPIMNLTAEEFDKLKERAYELAAVLRGDQVDALVHLHDAYDQLGVSLKALAMNVGSLGMGETFIQGLTGAVGIINNFIQNPIKGLEMELIYLKTLLLEVRANLDYFALGFLTMSFDDFKKKIADIEADGKRQLKEMQTEFPRETAKVDDRPEAPEIKKAKTGDASKAELKTREDQLKAELEAIKLFAKEKEQVVTTEILSENLDARGAAMQRAEIRRTEIDTEIAAIQKIFPFLEEIHVKEVDAAGKNVEKKIAADELYKDKVVKYNAEIKKLIDERGIEEIGAANTIIEINRKTQETIGKMEVDYAKQEYARNQQKIKDAEALAAAKVAIGNEQLLPPVEMANRQMGSIDAQIARLKSDQTVTNWTETEAKISVLRAQRDTQEEISQNNFVEGWARGLKQYVHDSSSAFGQAQTMARDTANAMTTGFETLFFDAMNNKLHSLKDVATSVFTFIQQLAAKTAAQWATTQLIGGQGAVSGGGGILGMLTGLFSGGGGEAAAAARGAANPALFGPGFAEGGYVRRRYFADGGPSGTDTIPAWLTPGEGVLSNTGMAALDKLNAGNSSSSRAVHVHMTINTPDANSFRQSRDQILLDIQRAMGHAQRNA